MRNLSYLSLIFTFRPYTRQCLPNASVATVGPTLGRLDPTTSLRAIRQKREMETRGDQDNQDKNDLQGKIQFYQQFCASQQTFGIAERKTQHNVTVGHSQQPAPSGNETAAAVASATRVINPCQFSTFKSTTTPGNRAAPPPPPDLAASLDLTGLNLGRSRELGSNRIAEVNSATTSREYYQPTMSRTRERSPNTASRQLDKQSYFFHGHKTEKDVDRKVVMFEDLGTKGTNYARLAANDADDTAMSGSMNCFGGPDKERSYADYDSDKKHRCSATNSVRRFTVTHEMRDSESVEFLEKEGEIFKKSSNELLQETFTSKCRNFSFRNKEKTHKSLESLDKSINIPAVDCKSLDFPPEEQSKTFFHGKQRSFDSTKKSVDSTANKSRKRPNFFQRVGRSLHFLPREREKRQDTSKREERAINSQYPQTDQEKCEYFLQRHQKNVDFFERTPSSLANRAPVQSNLGSFNEIDFAVVQNSASRLKGARLEESTFRAKRDSNKSMNVDTTEDNMKQNNWDASKPLMQSDISTNIELTVTVMQSRLPLIEGPIASVTTQDTVSGNKDSLDIGYSISELGRIYLHTIQNIDHADGLLSLENAADAMEKRKRYIEWLQTKNDQDILSHGANSRDSLTHGKPQGNLDILINILLDIFVWICI